jgi:hypothetical protein
MAITNGDMQLMAKSRRSKKVYVLRYEQPYEFDATPIQVCNSVATTAMAATSKKKGGRKSSTPQAPHSASIVASPLPRRPVHNTPRFYVEYIQKNMLSPTIRCAFLLRSFRIIHKLIGASSRIEWIIHNNNNNNSNNGNKTSAAAAAGPVLCTFFQGALAAERLVGVLMSLRIPPTRK